MYNKVFIYILPELILVLYFMDKYLWLGLGLFFLP